ncbi:MAG: electron transport complex protein RnfG [Lysobacterales bacterium]|jgi:electron transport complex protein RnfG
MIGISANMFRSAALLALIAVIGTGLLAGINELTKDRIVSQQRRLVLQQLNQLIPAVAYDNALHEDVIEFRDPVYFKHSGLVTVYRARLGLAPVAVVLRLVAPDGYNGDIHLLVGIWENGTIAGVRVISHRETPGLGDPIEHQRSDWVLGFDETSLDNPSEKGWAVKRDGGIFEQFTGATITPRAVVGTVQRALTYYSSHSKMLFEQQSMLVDHE